MRSDELNQISASNFFPHRSNHSGCFDERRCDLRHNCIAVAPQESHSTGYPMSQRECAGFNWPGFTVSAGEPVAVRPACKLSDVRETPQAPFNLAFRAKNCSGVPPASCAAGVAQLASLATSFNGRELSPCLLLAPDFQSLAVAVGQADRAAVFKSLPHPLRTASFSAPSSVRTDLSPSLAPVVGHPVEALSDMRRTDARCAQIRRPAGVLRSFQVIENKVEPVEASR